jgi:hypothetical protein
MAAEAAIHDNESAGRMSDGSLTRASFVSI